jgi:hypothetical protein
MLGRSSTALLMALQGLFLTANRAGANKYRLLVGLLLIPQFYPGAANILANSFPKRAPGNNVFFDGGYVFQRDTGNQRAKASTRWRMKRLVACVFRRYFVNPRDAKLSPYVNVTITVTGFSVLTKSSKASRNRMT